MLIVRILINIGFQLISNIGFISNQLKKWSISKSSQYPQGKLFYATLSEDEAK
jgi:hypothetical protein